MTQLKEPLEIPRQALIDKIQANLDHETAEREAEAAKAKAAKDAFSDFITENHEKVIGWVSSVLGFPGNFARSLEAIEEIFKDHDYTPKVAKPTKKENELEKLRDVLKISANETIQVTPDMDVYRLL